MVITIAPTTFAAFALPALMLALLGGPCPRPDLDVDRLTDANGEPGEPHNAKAYHEQHGARRGIGQLALHADELAHPAARTRHAVEEEHNAPHDAGEPDDQAGERVDQL